VRDSSVLPLECGTHGHLPLLKSGKSAISENDPSYVMSVVWNPQQPSPSQMPKSPLFVHQEHFGIVESWAL